MKVRSSLLTTVFALLWWPAEAQTSNGASAFRIVGYYSLQSAMTTDGNNIPFSKLTHINLYFLNPDSSGSSRRISQHMFRLLERLTVKM